MSHVKTAVSLHKSLFEQVEALARELKTSRSRVVEMSVEEMLRRRENRKLLEQINAACAGGLDKTEKAVLRGMRRVQRKLLEHDR